MNAYDHDFSDVDSWLREYVRSPNRADEWKDIPVVESNCVAMIDGPLFIDSLHLIPPDYGHVFVCHTCFLIGKEAHGTDCRLHGLQGAVEALMKIEDNSVRQKLLAEQQRVASAELWERYVALLPPGLIGSDDLVGPAPPGAGKRSPFWKSCYSEAVAAVLICAVVGFSAWLQRGKLNDKRHDVDMVRNESPVIGESSGSLLDRQPSANLSGTSTHTMAMGDLLSRTKVEQYVRQDADAPAAVLFMIDEQMIHKIAWRNGNDVVFAKPFWDEKDGEPLPPGGGYITFVLIALKEDCNDVETIELNPSLLKQPVGGKSTVFEKEKSTPDELAAAVREVCKIPCETSIVRTRYFRNLRSN